MFLFYRSVSHEITFCIWVDTHSVQYKLHSSLECYYQVYNNGLWAFWVRRNDLFFSPINIAYGIYEHVSHWWLFIYWRSITEMRFFQQKLKYKLTPETENQCDLFQFTLGHLVWLVSSFKYFFLAKE